MREFLAEVTTLVRPSLRSDIGLVTEISDQLWPVDSDAGALELAILNLAFNARDAMKDGGTLRIGAENVVLNGQPEGLKGEHVALRVTDTGTGMSADTKDRVFEPFFTTKGYGEGTGLGLSQVFGFIKQIGGGVTVESELGKGSTFALYLPASRGGSAAESRANGANALGRVLVVEDDTLVAELAANMLTELGFDAVVAHSAKEALDRLSSARSRRSYSPTSSCPGVSAASNWHGKCAAAFPELPILLTTGYSEQVSGTHGFPVLQKPYEMESLAGALSKMLKRDLPLH